MKKGHPPNTDNTKPLSRILLSNLMLEFKIGIKDPVRPLRQPNQQFGIYDEDDTFAGDICADGMFFTMDELRQKILGLFPGN